jgi:hypothetical protein
MRHEVAAPIASLAPPSVPLGGNLEHFPASVHSCKSSWSCHSQSPPRLARTPSPIAITMRQILRNANSCGNNLRDLSVPASECLSRHSSVPPPPLRFFPPPATRSFRHPPPATPPFFPATRHPSVFPRHPPPATRPFFPPPATPSFSPATRFTPLRKQTEFP